VLGLDGPQVVSAFAPWECELRVERATGRRISYRDLVGGVAATGEPRRARRTA
jgi:hypothetical protein